MRNERYQFTFNKSVSMKDVNETLILSALAAGHLYGSPTSRLEARYTIDVDDHLCEINVSTEIGRAIAKIFIGFITLEFGSNAFEVDEMIKAPWVK